MFYLQDSHSHTPLKRREGGKDEAGKQADTFKCFVTIGRLFVWAFVSCFETGRVSVYPWLASPHRVGQPQTLQRSACLFFLGARIKASCHCECATTIVWLCSCCTLTALKPSPCLCPVLPTLDLWSWLSSPLVAETAVIGEPQKLG